MSPRDPTADRSSHLSNNVDELEASASPTGFFHRLRLFPVSHSFASRASLHILRLITFIVFPPRPYPRFRVELSNTQELTVSFPIPSLQRQQDAGIYPFSWLSEKDTV